MFEVVNNKWSAGLKLSKFKNIFVLIIFIFFFPIKKGKWGYHRQGSCQAGLGADIAEVSKMMEGANIVITFIIYTFSDTKSQVLQRNSKTA